MANRDQNGILVQWILKTGLVNTPAAAHKVLYVILGVCILVLFWSMSGTGSSSYGNYDEMIERYPELAE